MSWKKIVKAETLQSVAKDMEDLFRGTDWRTFMQNELVDLDKRIDSMSKEERKECGLKGREWMIGDGNLNAKYMCDSLIATDMCRSTRCYGLAVSRFGLGEFFGCTGAFPWVISPFRARESTIFFCSKLPPLIIIGQE